MDKGIRINVNKKFLDTLPQRAAMGNTPFRKSIIAYTMETFNVSLASAATHYNHAFQQCKKDAAEKPELVELLGDLGRPEDKKGGRKKKVQPAAAEQQPSTEQQPAAAPAAEGGQQAENADNTPAVTLYNVTKKDGTVVAENLSFWDASNLVAKAKKAKKGVLTMKEVE